MDDNQNEEATFVHSICVEILKSNKLKQRNNNNCGLSISNDNGAATCRMARKQQILTQRKAITISISWLSIDTRYSL